MNLRTNFESGNIGPWELSGPRQLSFQAPLDGSPLAMWFYFCLEGVGAGPFEFIINNLNQCLESTHWGDVRPVLRTPDGEWQRANAQDVCLILDRGEFRFRFDLPDQPVEIAYSYPYPACLLSDLFKHLDQFSGVQVSYPGHSYAGRPLPYLVMGCTGSNSEPEIIWVHSREHAGEVSGGYALDGFLQAFAVSRLRQRFSLHSFPIIDLDAVIEGRYGKLSPPVDHHMCWTPDTPRPENALAMQLMRASAAAGKFRLLVNFHSPSPENECYLVPFNPTLLDDELRQETEKLAGCAKAHFPADFPLNIDEQAYQRVTPWWDDNTEHRPEAFVLSAFGASALTCEIAYHASSSGTPTSPQKLRQLGACVVNALEDYFLGEVAPVVSLYASLPPIYQQTRGWVLWSPPWYTRLTFEPGYARAVADSTEACAYFGSPRLYSPDQIGLRYLRRPGGDVFIRWLCYDRCHARLLATPAQQPLPLTQDFVPLKLKVALPPGTCFVRPSFWLSGAFRAFELIDA